MRVRFALLALVACGLCTVWATRGRTRPPPIAAGGVPAGPAAQPVVREPALASVAEGERAPVERAGAESATEPEHGVRVRVLDERSRTTLRDCEVWLELVDRKVGETVALPDGSHAFHGPIVPGTEVVVQLPGGWESEHDRIEIDAAPADELVFLARALPTGRLHGKVVDDVDGEPLSFLRFDADGEDLVTDATGAFEGREPHARGTLRFSAGNWTYEVGHWEPERDEPVVVPVRVGPMLFLELTRTPEAAWASWIEEPRREGAIAYGLAGVDRSGREWPGARIDLDPLPRVQFRWGTPPPTHGELHLVSRGDFQFGAAKLGPGVGTLGAPLPVALAPCGFIAVLATFQRSPSTAEERMLSFTLVDADGVDQAETSLVMHQGGFVVLEARELVLEARLADRVLARTSVSARLLETVPVFMPLSLPPAAAQEEAPRTADDPPEALHPFTALVTSKRNRHCDAQLILMRRSDGKETQSEVKWTKEDGRWLGRIAGGAFAGTNRVHLQLHSGFDWEGPRWADFPCEGELVFTIDDAVPLADVYMRPVAAEDGRPLLAFDAYLVIESGDPIGGDEFLGPSAPIITGHARTVPFDWTCSAPGRRVTCGSFEPDGEEGDIVIPVVLERGWGARVYVGDAARYGLAGVRVLADGVLAGVTSRSGMLCLGGERPERLTFEYQGWVDDGWGDIEPDGTFEDDPYWISVFLAPVRSR